jgi:hypothetical protein
MRINLTPIMMLTGFFVACGGTGDNFSDGGGEGGGGFGGSPTMDASSGGDDVISTIPDSSLDTGGGKDSPVSTCSATCTSNSECQSACGTSSTYCCDIPTGACYPTSLATCPSGVADSGGPDTAPY